MSEDSLGFSTRAVHAGDAHETAGDVTPAIHLSTTYSRDPQGELLGPWLYARLDNPNRSAVERTLVALEAGATEALAFASGLAASAAATAHLAAGERIVVEAGAYYGTLRLLDSLRARGVVVDHVDLTDFEQAATALSKPTKLVWCETPTNPMLRVADIARLAELAHARGARLLVDNTVATPLMQSPLQRGADLVLHAATKALGGHGDLTLGALVASKAGADWLAQARVQREESGAVPSPFDCWLLARGLATAGLRIRAQEANARCIAEELRAHPRVLEVIWPGLAEHPDARVVAQQMRGGGSLVSIRVRGGEEAATRVLGRLKLIMRATSFGGVHTLAEHRARVEGPSTRTPRDLIRLAMGIEDSADLLSDLRQALA
jgi:cystathionine gamma-synthase